MCCTDPGRRVEFGHAFPVFHWGLVSAIQNPCLTAKNDPRAKDWEETTQGILAFLLTLPNHPKFVTFLVKKQKRNQRKE